MDYYKKILITGSNGMLGKDIELSFLLDNKFDVFGINRKQDIDLDQARSIICNLTDFKELSRVLTCVRPDIIIHCAANVNVDKCEADKNYCYKLNSEAVRVLSSYNSPKTKFIYISTDSVFDGEKGNYVETDKTNPLNYYAFTKREGEKFALQENKNSIVARTNIYGFHTNRGNSLAEWAINNLSKKNRISGFDDVFFNPVYTKQFAEILVKLLDVDYKGLIHIGSNKYISKYEFLKYLCRRFDFDDTLLKKGFVNDVDFNAERPKNTTLDVSKLEKITGYSVNIEDGLESFYHDYNNFREAFYA
ncbi:MULTISPECIES: SDR family oxidoreductase [Clostridium]|uniref:dTDP-4-dehydrorhamnose reductase n=1 Tax=Clostridium lapidicellarium TaxID=3240931 RepID=A0ABV4E1B5_9CLOT